MRSRLLLLVTTLSLACGSDPGTEAGTDLGERYTAAFRVRQLGDGTFHASADILDADGCTVVLEVSVAVNGREMLGGFTAGVDACGATRYVYQATALPASGEYELTVDGHALAVARPE